MKINITRTALLEVLQVLQGVIMVRTTLPILSNVLLKAEKKTLHLTTTDLEVGVRCTIEADVIKEGSTTLPARRLVNIIKELPAEDVEIEVSEKNTASIKCGSSFFKIIGLSEDEFPAFPDFEGAFSYVMEQKVLKDMLKNVAYSASADETRHVHGGELRPDRIPVVVVRDTPLDFLVRRLSGAEIRRDAHHRGHLLGVE